MLLGVNLLKEVGGLNPNPSTNLGGKRGGKLMLNSKKIKALLFTISLSLLSVGQVHAASYTVKAGDSLYKIGKLFNTDATTIIKNNSLSSSVIYPGQVLNITSQTYTVKSGDSLYLISKQYGISVDSLRNANNKWDNYIYPGQVLNIPGGTISNNNSSSNTSKPVVPNGSSPVVSYTANDADLLARLITSEAEDQPYDAKVAVGAVVLNRVRDSRFPSTITSVIYEKSGGYYQFTPVLNGWINKPASQESIKAAFDALHGSDPTHGAVYYFDDSTTNSWLWSKPIALRIDKMVFTY